MIDINKNEDANNTREKNQTRTAQDLIDAYIEKGKVFFKKFPLILVNKFSRSSSYGSTHTRVDSTPLACRVVLLQL